MNLLRQLFKSDDPSHSPESVQETTPEGVAQGPQPSTHDLQIGLASDPGRIRDHNEDASLAWQFTLTQEGQPPQQTGLFILADGMGGHASGEQASALAVRMAADYVIRKVSLPQLSDDEDMAERAPIHEILTGSLRLAHQAIIRQFPEAGTTMTMALMMGNNVYIAHVGDSRAYQGERGSLRLLTDDHSVAARLLEMGQATAEEVASQRNILYKAIGQGVEVEPDIAYHNLDHGQYLLLCCDGLWGKIPDAEIGTIIEAAPTPDIACQRLVEQANKNGGEDNISVILVARGWPLPAREYTEKDTIH